MSEVAWLGQWFESQCDEEWEHHRGVRIETIDNPGWAVHIELNNAKQPMLAPQELREGDDEDDHWLRCALKDNVFVGYGGAGMLERIIGVFRGWMEAAETVGEAK